MFYYLGLVSGAILVILGLIGSILPLLPGPPLSFLGLFLVALVHNFSPPLTLSFVIVMLAITMGVMIIDYILPLISAKKYGTSKWGIFGSICGMIIGFFFSPLGVFIGALLGAVLSELMVSGKKSQAWRAGWGVFLGSIMAMILRIGVCGVMLYYSFLAIL